VVGRDVEGFEAAFDDLYASSHRLAVRLLGSQDAAEEISSEAMVRAYIHWRRVGTASWRTAWVLRVTTNLAIDAVRRERVIVSDRELVDTGVEDVVVMRQTLLTALAGLPRRQREAVALRYLGGLPETDVAAALGVTAGTVKTHLHRGLATLRAVLGSEEQLHVKHT
jgi:RNA polymerase sigma factor (sigma-70 family)